LADFKKLYKDDMMESFLENSFLGSINKTENSKENRKTIFFLLAKFVPRSKNFQKSINKLKGLS